MCNILILEPGQSLDKDKFYNMVYNNWHSWGLVTKVGDRLDIKRNVPESGENDPEEIWNAVEKDKDFLRFLHVRHTTAGKTDLENCHPFDVYYDPKSGRQVLFMHNGTLHTFKSMKPGPHANTTVQDDDGPSDTKNFVDEILIPYVAQADYGNGRGDISSKAVKMLLSRFWTGQNRGLLISSDAPFTLLQRSEWKEIPAEDGTTTIWSANDLYFDKVIRGPEFTRREAEKERLRLEEASKNVSEREAQTKALTTIPALTQLSDVNVRTKHPFFGLTEKISDILNDWDFYGDDRNGRATLGMATDAELATLYEDRDICIWLMSYMFGDYATLVDELKDIQDKKSKAELVIAALKKQIGKKEIIIDKAA